MAKEKPSLEVRLIGENCLSLTVCDAGSLSIQRFVGETGAAMRHSVPLDNGFILSYSHDASGRIKEYRIKTSFR